MEQPGGGTPKQEGSRYEWPAHLADYKEERKKRQKAGVETAKREPSVIQELAEPKKPVSFRHGQSRKGLVRRPRT